ncbi:MAG: UDP-N-acetylmuramoyl-tripeptide--D-alanyl-D-alanine ligase, partial [Deltaproteobacteria bacterium]|nr:UDP-N-acetylmuramoyl-tripeptide--D-alanyl-D-alanine ligase [Deltaproteobacteria bacterium]
VIAVTGTNGKTTTRQMIVSIMGKRFRVLTPRANYNNLVGLPLTLLNLESSHQAAVLEMGMNCPGEISRLTEIADPDLALITNVGPAHLEGVGSLEGVARAKGELFEGLKPGATAIINTDDPLVARLAERLHVQGISFGFNRKASVRALGLRHRGLKGVSFKLKTPSGNAKIDLSLFGKHNASNALAAAAVATALNIDPAGIRDALAEISPFPGRLELKKLPGPVYLLDDTYNANPASTRAALNVLMKLKSRGRAVAVLGDMLELGDKSNLEHARIGQAAARLAVDFLVGIGPLTKIMLQSSIKYGLAKKQTIWFGDPEDGARWVSGHIQIHDRVLVKGSRGMRMERAVHYLTERNQESG